MSSEPEVSDEAVVEATGHTWEEWCARIDGWPGHADGHTAVVTWLVDHHDLPSWWAQTVTVGWERMTGRRARGQMPDGTFTANKSRTVATAAARLRADLLDDRRRGALFPGVATELRSGPTAKVIRLGVGPGVALVAIEPRDDGRATVTVSHEKLPSHEAVDEWKAFWAGWLSSIDGR